MAEVVNLRLARRQKQRASSKAQADRNRASYGVSKRVKAAGKAAQLAEKRRFDGHLLEKGDSVEP